MILRIDDFCRWDASVPEHTWDRLMANKDKELDRLNGVYMKILKNAGVEFIEGRGKIVDAHTVDVDGKRYTVSNLKGRCIGYFGLIWVWNFGYPVGYAVGCLLKTFRV